MIGNLIGSYRMLGRSEKALLFGQAASVIGDFMALPAFAILAARREPIVLTLFFVCYFLPRCAQPFLGALVDRFDTKRVALLADAARAAIFIVLFLYPESYPSAPWLLVAFAASTFGALFEPARLKIMSSIAVDFVSYSRVFNFVYSLAGVASLGFALLIETYASTEAVFAANALTFVISFGFLLLVTYRPGRAIVEQAGMGRWVEGFRLFVRHRTILVTCGLVILADFYTGVLYEAFPHKAALLGWDNAGTYIFYFFVCLGNTIGALFVRPNMWGERNLGLLCALGAGSASIFFVSTTWSLLLISCLCFFSVQILAIVLAEIAIQHVIPSEYQGRVFGISESLPYLALSLGSSTSGLLGGPAIAVLCVASFLIFFLCARTGNRWELAKANA
jgi:hypothetical protein